MLKKLYDKSEIWFAVTWIIVYVILASIADNISTSIGISKIITTPILLILSIVLFIFVKNNGLLKKYGLCKSKLAPSKLLFYIPLVVLITANLWYGVSINTTLIEIVLYILSMFSVGFLEEMIFRGFLFKAMAKNGVKSAIIVSSITFGIGHIVNLINGSGATLLPNLLQVIYAVSTGFAFVMIFYKTGSLIPCILTHCIFNSLSIFVNEALVTIPMHIITSILITIISGGYAIYITLAVTENNISSIKE